MKKENLFQGQRVRLRSPEPSDAPIHFEIDTAYTNMARASYSIQFPRSLVQAENWAKREAEAEPQNHHYRLAIEVCSSGELVGGINTFHCNLQHGTFSYGLGIFPPYHRQGYASEAIILLLRYFFMELRYQKVGAHVYSFNTASIGLHERLGFTQEGRMRRMFYTAGAYHDEIIFGMLSEEFQAKHRNYWQENSV